jgi:hypothetical protein
LTRWTTAGLRGGCAGVLLLLCARLATANISGPVVSVLDGDTIEVLHNTRPERVRLSGIDCPEKGQAYSNRAKQAASALVFGKDIILQTHGQDKYGRTLADVISWDGTYVNHTLDDQSLFGARKMSWRVGIAQPAHPSLDRCCSEYATRGRADRVRVFLAYAHRGALNPANFLRRITA